jgi:hypothetical protein
MGAIKREHSLSASFPVCKIFQMRLQLPAMVASGRSKLLGNKISHREITEIREWYFAFAYLAWFAVQFGMDNRRRRAQCRARERNQRR